MRFEAAANFGGSLSPGRHDLMGGQYQFSGDGNSSAAGQDEAEFDTRHSYTPQPCPKLKHLNLTTRETMPAAFTSPLEGIDDDLSAQKKKRVTDFSNTTPKPYNRHSKNFSVSDALNIIDHDTRKNRVRNMSKSGVIGPQFQRSVTLGADTNAL